MKKKIPKEKIEIKNESVPTTIKVIFNISFIFWQKIVKEIWVKMDKK